MNSPELALLGLAVIAYCSWQLVRAFRNRVIDARYLGDVDMGSKPILFWLAVNHAVVFLGAGVILLANAVGVLQWGNG